MPRRLSVISISGALLVAMSAAVQAEERCTGTLCDFYYGGSAPEAAQPAKPAAPTPIMVPRGGLLGFVSNGGSAQETAPSDASGTPSSTSTAATSRVRIGGGGLLGFARGDTPERCTGSLCDFYYGGSPPEKAEAAPVAAPANAAPSDAAAADDVDEAPTPRRRRGVEYVQQDQKPRCAATPQDPWRCYR